MHGLNISVQVVQQQLFEVQGFSIPPRDTSAVRAGTRVEHPGVWEQPR